MWQVLSSRCTPSVALTILFRSRLSAHKDLLKGPRHGTVAAVAVAAGFLITNSARIALTCSGGTARAYYCTVLDVWRNL